MRAMSTLLPLAMFAIVAGCARSRSPVAPLHDAELLMRAAASDSFVAELEFRGDLLTLDAAWNARLLRNRRFFVRENAAVGLTQPFPTDTVPVGAELVKVRWLRVSTRSVPVASEPSRDTSVVFPPGVHSLHLRAPERAGGGIHRVDFVVGLAPVAWWAGPDPALWPRASDGDGRAVDVTDWRTFTTSTPWPPDGRGAFGPDSFRTRPLQRVPVNHDPERRTFYEIHGDRIYARSEGDTVHFGATIVCCLGGFDPDSPYSPIAPASSASLPPGFASDPVRYAVLVPEERTGSPSGFRTDMFVRLPGGDVLRTTETVTFPNFDDASVFFSPHVAGYLRAERAGKYYVLALGEDAEGGRSRRLSDLAGETDLVDAGGGTPEQRAARRAVLTFHVRPSPTGTAAR